VPSYTTGPFGGSNSALSLTGHSDSYLSTSGNSAPAALPSAGDVPWSASAWIKCEAPRTWAGVLSWGAAGDHRGGASSKTVAIAVSGTRTKTVSGDVSTLAGGGTETTNCGSECRNDVGTAARFAGPQGLAVDSSGNVYVSEITAIAFAKLHRNSRFRQ